MHEEIKRAPCLLRPAKTSSTVGNILDIAREDQVAPTLAASGFTLAESLALIGKGKFRAMPWSTCAIPRQSNGRSLPP